MECRSLSEYGILVAAWTGIPEIQDTDLQQRVDGLLLIIPEVWEVYHETTFSMHHLYMNIRPVQTKVAETMGEDGSFRLHLLP